MSLAEFAEILQAEVEEKVRESYGLSGEAKQEPEESRPSADEEV